MSPTGRAPPAASGPERSSPRSGTLEAEILGYRHELLLQQTPATKEPRPNGTDRDAHDLGGGLVRHVFDIHQDHGRAEGFCQLVERFSERRSQIETGEEVVISPLPRCGIDRAGRDGILLAVLEIDRGTLPLT